MGELSPVEKRELLPTLHVHAALSTLVNRGQGLLEAGREQVQPMAAVNALRALALYVEDVPALVALARPLGSCVVQASTAATEHDEQQAAEQEEKQEKQFSPPEVAQLVWAIGELRLSAPELLDTVLPHFVDTDPRHRRVRGLKYKMERNHLSDVRMALHKIRRDV